jgi:hypothetical protein
VYPKVSGRPSEARTANGTAVTRCSCFVILWVALVSFAAITLCVASQRVFIIVVYFVMTQSGNFWIHPHISTPSYILKAFLIKHSDNSAFYTHHVTRPYSESWRWTQGPSGQSYMYQNSQVNSWNIVKQAANQFLWLRTMPTWQLWLSISFKAGHIWSAPIQDFNLLNVWIYLDIRWDSLGRGSARRKDNITQKNSDTHIHASSGRKE